MFQQACRHPFAHSQPQRLSNSLNVFHLLPLNGGLDVAATSSQEGNGVADLKALRSSSLYLCHLALERELQQQTPSSHRAGECFESRHVQAPAGPLLQETTEAQALEPPCQEPPPALILRELQASLKTREIVHVRPPVAEGGEEMMLLLAAPEASCPPCQGCVI
eukprot:766238-Hanusia_phi.AAC.2